MCVVLQKALIEIEHADLAFLIP